MIRFSLQISKYLIRSILPYFIFSWLLLSVILFVQQAGRFSDIFFSANIPKNLIWQLTFALIPNVIAFTCPMAVLVGVIIGLSKMQGDSEIIAVRAAGCGNFQMALPVIVLGILLSLLALFINLKGVPFAAQVVRQIALQTAIYKLESPIEPGVFNTEMDGYTIYVKDGDFEKGTWKNIFIYTEEKKDNLVRLITSKSGRIDNTDDKSELILDNAVANTFSTVGEHNKFVSENVGQIRYAIETKRSQVIEKLKSGEGSPEELGLNELSRLADAKDGKEKIEAQLLWQRRIIHSITPLIFALLGTALVLRFNRGGRGFGIFLALVSLVIYYLLALLGEQLARTGQIGVLTAGLIPMSVSIFFIIWFFASNRLLLKKSIGGLGDGINIKLPAVFRLAARRSFYNSLTTGILDLDIAFSLINYFLLSYSFLTTIYMIFTAFELWKFAGDFDRGINLLIKYLLYLTPFIYIQLAPSCVMIAILVTYVVKSRQNEVVTWTAAGQSVYRLLLPCFVLMFLIGGLNWGIQELILPQSNIMQDDLRNQIRSRGITPVKTGRNWVAGDQRIYSFELNDKTQNNVNILKNLTVYEFSEKDAKLQSVYKTPEAELEKNKLKLSNTEKIDWSDGQGRITNYAELDLPEISNPFINLNEKPSHLSSRQIREQLKNIESDGEQRSYQTALEKKSATAFLPFLIPFFIAPFALSLSRKGKVVTIGCAVGMWLLFMGISSTFEQFGLNGLLDPRIAVWSPIAGFAALGAYLLSKIKT